MKEEIECLRTRTEHSEWKLRFYLSKFGNNANLVGAVYNFMIKKASEKIVYRSQAIFFHNQYIRIERCQSFFTVSETRLARLLL